MKLCSVPCCDRLAKARGMCSTHYRRWRLYGDTFPDQPVRPLLRPQGRRPLVIGDATYEACPEDLLPLVAQAVQNDAAPIFRVLWRAIAQWSLQSEAQ